MDRITTDLFVGSIESATDSDRLEAAAITPVCKLTHDPPTDGYPESVSVVDSPMMDGPRNDPATFQEAVEEVVAASNTGETVLVHCSRGSSRSPAVAAAALAVRRGWSVETALAEIRKSRPEADPHPALVRRAESTLERFG